MNTIGKDCEDIINEYARELTCEEIYNELLKDFTYKVEDDDMENYIHVQINKYEFNIELFTNEHDLETEEDVLNLMLHDYITYISNDEAEFLDIFIDEERPTINGNDIIRYREIWNQMEEIFNFIQFVLKDKIGLCDCKLVDFYNWYYNKL